MTEVTLVKRLLILAAGSLLILSAAACQREKPPAVEPTLPIPTVVGLAGATPTLLPPGTLSVQTTPVSTTPSATEAVGVTPGATSPATANTPVVVTTAAPTSAELTPLATAAATSAPPASGTGTTAYTVQLGDTLYSIAAKYGVTVQQIQAANPGLNPTLLVPGTVLNIPAPSTAAGATPTPLGFATAVPVAPSTGGTTTTTACPSRYTVQRGEWFYAIARKCGVTVQALRAANPGRNPNVLYPGQVLNIPGGDGTTPPGPSDGTTSNYTVQPGDTLYSIAVHFGKTVYALQLANHLASPNWIYPGQVLIIP